MDVTSIAEWVDLIEKHPTGILVVVLAIGNAWQARRLTAARKEVNTLIRALLSQGDAINVDSETTEIITRGKKR